ncbi:hypothetical protein [Rhizobium grahamii]|uniref:Uncharacterized protein n=1 Tax=Rhizobium grahamii CCGE 502 TaxID=990285 RepID=S3HL33_9HYPH|nr:hypothetical protein [Rhizobium grahamii]EPE98775.1 hypothetical protein RGCCGE502_10120 [Rhizobium grahamii CCGE 502]
MTRLCPALKSGGGVDRAAAIHGWRNWRPSLNAVGGPSASNALGRIVNLIVGGSNAFVPMRGFVTEYLRLPQLFQLVSVHQIAAAQVYGRAARRDASRGIRTGKR